ncbi:MAG: DNA modification methylase [Minisyncoccia bacterium]
MIKINISEIKPNDHNPRDITPEKFAKLVKSIKEFPEMLEVRPLVIDENNIVLGGNMRLRALEKAGVVEVPVEQVRGWTEEQKKEFIIKDNIGYGEWDWELLANEWEADLLQDWGLDIPGFEEEELEAEEDDYQVPDEIQTDIQLGDIIEIGEHRLMCGDSTDITQVEKLMGGEKADLAHNDPPYGMKKEKDGVINDNLNFDDLLQFNKDWIALQFAYLKDNGSWYCWGIDEPLMDIYSEILKPYIKQQKATFRNLITWDKGNGQGQNSENTRSYAIADEKCLFVMCGVQGFNNNADNYFEGWEPVRDYLLKERKKAGWDIPTMKKIAGHSDLSRDHWTSKSQFNLPTKEVYKKFQTYCQQNNIDAFKKEYDELKKEYYSTRAYFNNVHDNFNNVWKFERHLRQGNEGGHATPKPIPLCERVIKSSCPDKGLVIDFFLGSGSTMVAAHQLNRKCYEMELDPKYCQVIIDRMLKLDPSLEIKKNGLPYVKTE